VRPLFLTILSRDIYDGEAEIRAWIPTYAWSGGKSDPKNVQRIRASIEKCENHGIDVWVIDHLLSAPGLYGNAWHEPLNALAFAAALTRKVKIATAYGQKNETIAGPGVSWLPE
jgi:hypothetical protein